MWQLVDLRRPALLLQLGLVIASVVRITMLGAFALGLVAASPAFAQSLTPASDSSDDAGFLSGYRAVAPLRLSLEASISPQAGGFPNCVSREDAAGNSVGGIPVQHFVMKRLTPRLVLSGFSQLGCPIDAGLGGALTYTAPLSASSGFVFGAGLYVAPGQVPLFGSVGPSFMNGIHAAPSATNMAGRADFVWKATGGRTFNLGVQTLGRGMQSVTFGGGF